MLLYLGAYDELVCDGRSYSSVNKGLTLSKMEYLFVEDQLTGNISVVRGPCVWFPGPHEQPSNKKTAIALEEDEYVLLQDAATGQRWVHKGKALVFLEPTWRDSGVRKAVTLKS